MKVEIYQLSANGQDELAGVLRLHGGRIVAEPDSKLLRGILAEPLYDRRTDRIYDAASEPADFLLLLHRQYTSAYLRASKAVGDGRETRHVRADDYLSSGGD